MEPNLDLYDIVSCLTKFLLGYGAANQKSDLDRVNWEPAFADFMIEHKKWQYYTKVPFSTGSDDDEPKEALYQGSNFYSPYSDDQNNLARRAVLNIFAHTGTCDHHADITLLLLKLLLPIDTEINKCSFYDHKEKKLLEHYFIVVGHLEEESHKLSEEKRTKVEQDNDQLFVIDPWVAHEHGVTKLQDYWLRTSSRKAEKFRYSLITHFISVADGQDLLFKRVIKQKNILDTKTIRNAEQQKDAINSQKNSNSYLDEMKQQFSLNTIKERYTLCDEQHITTAQYPFSFLNRTKKLKELTEAHPHLRMTLFSHYEQIKNRPKRPGTQEIHQFYQSKNSLTD